MYLVYWYCKFYIPGLRWSSSSSFSQPGVGCWLECWSRTNCSLLWLRLACTQKVWSRGIRAFWLCCGRTQSLVTNAFSPCTWLLVDGFLVEAQPRVGLKVGPLVEAGLWAQIGSWGWNWAECGIGAWGLKQLGGEPLELVCLGLVLTRAPRSKGAWVEGGQSFPVTIREACPR